MVEVRGNAVAHTAEGHLGLPMATDRGIRPTHRPQQPRPTGLDWNAVAPACSVCGQGSSELRDGSCPLCRGVAPTPKDRKEGGTARLVRWLDDVERRFTTPAAPTQTPSSVGEPPGSRATVNPRLAHLTPPSDVVPPPLAEPGEEPDPASRWYSEWLEHKLTLEHDLAHVVEVMTLAARSTDRVVVQLRRNVLGATEALRLFMEAVADERPPVAPPVSEAPTFVLFEKPRGKWKRVEGDLAVQVVERYKAGEGAPKIAESVGCSTATVYNVLGRAGVSRRRTGRPRSHGARPDSRSGGR